MTRLFHSRRVARGKLINLLIRLMESDELRMWRNRTAAEYGSIRRSMTNVPNPYTEHNGSGERADYTGTLFITGRFRSGSTLLWNLFRKLDGHTAYYEPFNERRWFDGDVRGNHTDSTHRGVDDYWTEYAGLTHLAEYYQEDWIQYRLYMGRDSYEPAMQAFIDELILAASGRAVLQFNRVDFRLPWLRENYPGATILHIYRNPRDQWCSVLRGSQYPLDAETAAGFQDHFYQNVWVRDLCRQFPFLADFKGRHQYFTFYLLWKLSFDFGIKYADLSISMERLTATPREALADILAATRSEADVSRLNLAFIDKPESRWQSYASDQWFQAIEMECEVVLNNFFVRSQGHE